MDKIKFNSLNETKKVECILNLIKKNSLSEISTILGMKKNSIKLLMDKNGYIFNGKTFLKPKDITPPQMVNTNKTSTPSDRLYALEMRIFELETITRSINSDLQNHKQNHQNINAFSNSLSNDIVLKENVIDTLNTFLDSHNNINKNDLINKAILEYIENYDKLVIYSKKGLK